jgi:error-prone DNA polymerase
VSAAATDQAGYVELHCHSAYSFLDGASSPVELAAAAAEHGRRALAITDHDGLWGAMEFAHACRGVGVRPITGVELTIEEPGPQDDRFHLTLLAEDATGYRNLCHLVTEAHRGTRPRPDREPLPPSVALAELERRAEGLVCLSGCARDGALAKRWADDDRRGAETLGRRLVSAFGPQGFRVELQRPMWRRDRSRNRWLASLAERLGVACVATGDVHAHAATRARLQDALVAVRLRATLEESEPRRRGNAASAMTSTTEIAARFRDHPDAVVESGRLEERLRFDLTSDLGYRYPGSEDPGADRRLAELCRSRLDERYPPGRSNSRRGERAEAERRLEEELRVIRSLGLSGFFLLHRDLLELAREVAREVRGRDSARALLPPGRGRGSSVSSIVCYLTGLSHVDPVRCGLFLGRFLNEEVSEAPDIDLDFPRDIRETLIPRVHERYGPERSALVAAFATYRSRGAVRDLGKALGLPPGEIERVARSVDIHTRPDEVERDVAEAIGLGRARSVRWRALVELGREAWGLPRHLSQHPGGMVLSTRPLIDLCPVQPVAMEGRQAVQWDKDSCADAGFLKIDLLGLGMLSAVERCVEDVARVRGERIDLSRIPLDDPEVYRTIQRAETTGVFQIESRAQMQMLRRSRPENLDDLTVQVALVRPGPIQGGAVHPYLERRRRQREDPAYEVPYDHPSLEPILADTLGAIVFQDQVIQVAMALAGFSPGEAEGLRRAMSRKRSEAALRAYRERFVEGAVERGVAEPVAVRAFDGIMGFSGFGFPKSHAAAFALLAYQSTWLRVHYGPEFLCALLNEQPMGFYPPDSLVHEAQRRGIEIKGPDVNRSAVQCSVETADSGQRTASDARSAVCGPLSVDLSVRIGLGYVTGLREDDAAAVVDERRRAGPYRDPADLASRAGVGRDALSRLGWADACESIAGSRRRALWRLGVAASGSRAGAGVQLALPLPVPAGPSLREQTPWEQVVAEYASVGIALEHHPMKLLRAELPDRVASSATVREIRDGSAVEVAGMVVARQRPATARGVVFMLLEDELGTINVIVPPPVYERHRLIVRTASFASVDGRLERREGTINVVATRLSPLSRPDLPVAEIRHIEPPRERETGRRDADAGPTERELHDLDAVLPAAHSFGRRGR